MVVGHDIALIRVDDKAGSKRCARQARNAPGAGAFHEAFKEVTKGGAFRKVGHDVFEFLVRRGAGHGGGYVYDRGDQILRQIRELAGRDWLTLFSVALVLLSFFSRKEALAGDVIRATAQRPERRMRLFMVC